MKISTDVTFLLSLFLLVFIMVYSKKFQVRPGGHSIVKNTGAASIVWGLGFWLGKDILGFFKNIDLDNS